MSFTLCTSGAAINKAGTNVSATAIASAALLDQFSDDAEGLISSTSRFDFVTNFASLATNAKVVLARIASALIAMDLVNYSIPSYKTRSEAETILDVLNDQANKGLSLIKDQKVTTFIKT